METRVGQEGKSSAHFVSFDGKKAYKIFCSCDAFILAFSELHHYAEDMKKAIENRDINRIISIIRSCEDDVKEIGDYQRFLDEEIEDHVINCLVEDGYDYVQDLDEVYEEVEVVHEGKPNICPLWMPALDPDEPKGECDGEGGDCILPDNPT